MIQKRKEKVDIKGEFNFDNNAFSSGTGANVFENRKANLERVKSSKPVKRKKAGRPIEIEDPRYKVVRSKKSLPCCRRQVTYTTRVYNRVCWRNKEN